MRLSAMAAQDGWPSARFGGCTEPGLQAGSPAAYAPDLHLGGLDGIRGHIGAHTCVPANALSSASRARPLASGTRCPYRSTVVEMDLWPSQGEGDWCCFHTPG